MKRRDFFVLPLVAPLGAVRFAPRSDWVERSEHIDERIEAFRQEFHPDFRTDLPGVDYYFLGNGRVMCAVQHVKESVTPSATFLGFTMMHAERFARKASTMYFHPERGFGTTMLHVSVDGKSYSPTRENFRSLDWIYRDRTPVILLRWGNDAIECDEEFFIPLEGHSVYRTITVQSRARTDAAVLVTTFPYPNFFLFDDIAADQRTRSIVARGYDQLHLTSPHPSRSVHGRYQLTLDLGTMKPQETRTARYIYSLGVPPDGNEKVFLSLAKRSSEFWRNTTLFTTDDARVQHLFDVSKTLLRSMIGASGKRDAGIWQYNMEWVRDDCMAAMGLTLAGMFDEARVLLEKVIAHSIGDDGRTIDASRWSGHDYTELDQNGQLVYASWLYLCFSGDIAFIKRHWKKLALAIDFPLQKIFRTDATPLVRNKREYWERSDGFGVRDGFELAYQVWTVLGLEKAIDLAGAIGEKALIEHWREEAAALRKAILHDARYAMHADGHFIKRRSLDAEWQRKMTPPDRSRMPAGSPIATESEPACEPDSSELLPLLFRFIEPDDPLARGTLQWIEQLWNQRWASGGYSRYNVSSEPDPPAPWPLVTVMAARAAADLRDEERFTRAIEWLCTIDGGKSGSWFERCGPSITPPAPPVGIVGWIWYELTALVVNHLLGVRPSLNEIEIAPRLMGAATRMELKIRIGDTRVHCLVQRSEAESYAIVDGKRVIMRRGVLTVARKSGAMRIEIHLANNQNEK